MSRSRNANAALWSPGGGRTTTPRRIHIGTPGSQTVTPTDDTTYSDIFLREQTEVISVEGVEVRRRLVLPAVPPGSALTVRFDRYRRDVAQGVVLSIKRGKFVVRSERSADMVLWSDTAPAVVELAMTHRVPADVILWNTWRGWGGWPVGSTGYAGMRVTSSAPGVWRLNCSDGVGGPDFADLVVDVRLIPPTAGE